MINVRESYGNVPGLIDNIKDKIWVEKLRILKQKPETSYNRPACTPAPH